MYIWRNENNVKCAGKGRLRLKHNILLYSENGEGIGECVSCLHFNIMHHHHQENSRALFCPDTICESLAVLGHMQDDARALLTDHQCYEPLVRCTRMVLCVEGEKYLCMHRLT